MSAEAPASAPALPAGTLPDGLRVYAVGDIHGRLDLLEALAEMIARDLKERPVAQSVEVFLGDYVDRGRETFGVVEWLISTPPICDARICLMGNHEAMLLGAIEEPSEMSNWLFNGGGETIASYLVGKIERPDFSTSESLRQAFLTALPESHRAFFAGLPRTWTAGGYLFVHAGIRPGVPLDAQAPDDLVWIRHEFLNSDADFGKVVVHGHTPVDAPDVQPNRINIDTGAVFSGRLTCLVLEGGTHRFLSTEPNE